MLIQIDLSEFQPSFRVGRQRVGGHQPDDLALEHADAVHRGFASDGIEHGQSWRSRW